MKSLLNLHKFTFQQHIYLNHKRTWIGARNFNKNNLFSTKPFFKSSTEKPGCGSNYERIIKIVIQGAN